MGVEYREEPCRSALNRVRGMPFGWSLNPYMGCAHRCTFCYVRAFELRADRPSDDRYGTSIRLGGLDQTNSNTLDRAIVAHSAQYVTEAHVAKWGKCGRSNGCFAMGPEDFREALWHLSGGRLLYADRLGIT